MLKDIKHCGGAINPHTLRYKLLSHYQGLGAKLLSEADYPLIGSGRVSGPYLRKIWWWL